MRVYGLRGATSVPENTAAAILDGTEELMRELLARNELAPEELVSCLFTLTDDLNADFPAAAARRLGLTTVPLLCAREVDVPGALPRIVRVLIHVNADDGWAARHVYLHEARALRADLADAQ